MTLDIVDTDDFCRSCYGRGGWSDEHGYTPCWSCNGTGKRTVLVLPKEKDEK